MRMRRKKHLESRTLACEDYLISAETEDLNFQTAKEKHNFFNLNEIFGNMNPVYLEIGCGKGQFACEIAKKNPNFNYLAVEKVANVIVSAAERAKRENIPNVRFVKCGAEYLECFIPEKSISGIFLNFSCPFPKNAYAGHRLTNHQFLAIYKRLMIDGAEIHQKTDNRNFFEYSVEELSKFGFTIKNISLDLHNSDFKDNIITEYESKFIAQGVPIYRLEAYLKKPGTEGFDASKASNKENVLISECLLGIDCKYNGKANHLYTLDKLKEKFNLIPVCPECLGGLPIPRNPSEIKEKRVVTQNGNDVTEQFEKGAQSVLKLAQIFNCKKAILKSNSPSCGYGKIYDGTFSHTLVDGVGVTANLLSKNNIIIYNEKTSEDLL